MARLPELESARNRVPVGLCTIWSRWPESVELYSCQLSASAAFTKE